MASDIHRSEHTDVPWTEDASPSAEENSGSRTAPHQPGDAGVKWNRSQVSRCLLPVLRCVDGETDDALSPEERKGQEEAMREAICRHPQLYRQLSRVFREGDQTHLEQWFGWIDCAPEQLEDAFDRIDDGLDEAEDTQAGEDKASYGKNLYFMNLFRITDGGEPVDLAYPFEQYYFCDGVVYRDYLLRRVELGEKCRAWIRRYLPYYHRISTWYRENGGEKSGLPREYCAYMELLDYFMARCSYEDRLRDQRRALEYERGGLGWFHRQRKREIDRELEEVTAAELKMRMEDARERYEAYEAQFSEQRDAWEWELEHAPFTAFGRKKELKHQLTLLEEKLASYRAQVRLDELTAEYRRMSGKTP